MFFKPCYNYVLFLFYNIKIFMIELQYKLERAIEEERYEEAAEIQKKNK